MAGPGTVPECRVVSRFPRAGSTENARNKVHRPSLVDNQPRNLLREPENDVFRRGITYSSIAAGFSRDNLKKPGSRGSRVPGAQKVLKIKCCALPLSRTSLGTRCGNRKNWRRFSTLQLAGLPLKIIQKKLRPEGALNTNLGEGSSSKFASESGFKPCIKNPFKHWTQGTNCHWHCITLKKVYKLTL